MHKHAQLEVQGWLQQMASSKMLDFQAALRRGFKGIIFILKLLAFKIFIQEKYAIHIIVYFNAK